MEGSNDTNLNLPLSQVVVESRYGINLVVSDWTDNKVSKIMIYEYLLFLVQSEKTIDNKVILPSLGTRCDDAIAQQFAVKNREDVLGDVGM